MNSEHLKDGSNLFFELLKNQILPINNNYVQKYLGNSEVRQVTKSMAESAGLIILETQKHIHLISNSVDSKFATSYTQMKEKYTDLKLKSYFNLANVVISIFISLIDKEDLMQMQIAEEGITYYKLEDEVTNTLNSWKEKNEDDEEFSKDWRINVDEIYELWTNWPHHKVNKDDDISLRKSENKLGFIHDAIKPLKDQGLVIDHQSDYRIIPKEALYERIEEIYHRRDRYKEIMELIEMSGKDA